MTFVVLGLALCLGVLLAAFDSADSATTRRLERFSAVLIAACAAVGVLYTLQNSLLN